MAYVINDSCVSCGACATECPVNAISQGDTQYEIETVLIKWERIKSVKGADDCLLLMFTMPKYSFLAIPYDAFDDESHLREALSIVRSHVNWDFIANMCD